MYDGTDFHGWQSQSDASGIQDYIETCLKKIGKKDIRIHGSGRTDAGVHARGQVFHFDLYWTHGSGALMRALNTLLPRSIQITDVQMVNDSFHARYSVRKKRYVYYIFLGHASPFDVRYMWSVNTCGVDVSLMNQLSACLLGVHNFSAFSALNDGSDGVNPVKNLLKLAWELHGQQLVMTTEASGYLYKMVRTLTATLLSVGTGRLNADYVLECFHSCERREKIVTAPPCGLFLDQVFYD